MNSNLKSIRLHFIILGLMAGGLASCNEESVSGPQGSDPNSNPNSEKTTVINISLEDFGEAFGQPSSRVVLDTETDGWSYIRFSTDRENPDRIGFYSLYGNKQAEDANGPFINEPMLFTGYSNDRMAGFSSSDMDCDLSSVVWNKTAAYFPYSDSMEGSGIELRKIDETGTYRCVDLLFLSNISQGGSQTVAGMTGNFNHIFSEIVIYRGEGFQNPPDGKDEITIVLDKGVSHARLVDNRYPDDRQGGQNSWKMVELFYDEANSLGLSETQCQEWKAWKSPLEGLENENIFYVIVPTMFAEERSVVKYIKIYDDFGELHYLSQLPLSRDNKVVNGYKYNIEIKMEGLVATVNPFDISEWNDGEGDTDITQHHAAGISDPVDLKRWAESYNAFKTGGGGEDIEKTLSEFGDKIIGSDNSIHWHFYITDDIVFNTADADLYKNLKIDYFDDILDGQHNTISNLFIEGAGLFGTIGNNGSIINLHFDALSVENSGQQPAGGLAQNISGGEITGCSIDATVISDGPAGILAGNLSNAKVSGNSFTGLVIASSTSQDPLALAGNISSSEISGNNLAGVLFTVKSN